MALSVAQPTLHDRGKLANMFQAIQRDFITRLEGIEAEACGKNHAQFELKPWKRSEAENDGGTMAVMRGEVFEKVGANFSSVRGRFPEQFADRVLGVDARNLDFWASGFSFVAHPKNPFAPIGHMNVRAIETTNAWFGGGGDLTPVFPFEEDTRFFHETLAKACPGNYYATWKEECDKYFYLPHRSEPRGVGGIFFDHLRADDGWDDASFLMNIAQAFLHAYATLIEKRYATPYGDDERAAQSIKRARYVEFNLLYDRGTLFGLQTGGNTEAILVSLPPMASW